MIHELKILRYFQNNLRISFYQRLFSSQPLTSSIQNDSHSRREIKAITSEQKKLSRLSPPAMENMERLKVAIIGAPNAGKSTLCNKLIGWKFAPVSQKVHTTRKQTLGILTENNKQVIFLDTPGVIIPSKTKKHNLELSLLIDPHEALQKADLIAVVVDVTGLWNRSHLETEVLKMLSFHHTKPSILVLNKVDAFKSKDELLNVVRVLTEGSLNGVKYFKKHNKHIHLVGLDGKSFTANTEDNSTDAIEENDNLDEDISKNNKDATRLDRKIYKLNDVKEWKEYYETLKKIGEKEKGRNGWNRFSEVFMVSAKEGDGLFELRNYLMDSTRPGKWLYDDRVVTNEAPLYIAQQIVTEKLLDNLPSEIPYQIKIRPVMWHVGEDKLLRAQFELICSRKRHFYQVMGKDGSKIRKISMEVKQELLNVFKRDMTLQLIVKSLDKSFTFHKRKFMTERKK